jgi:parallel beta-helix repeat protein
MRATKLIVTVIWILVISGFAVSNVYGENTITVDDSGGANYTSIQDAVNNANDGDTILVYTGTYTENVDVKKRLIIKSDSGNPDDTIVQAADPDDHVFHVTADNVIISGFRVTGANNYGIRLEGVEECAVINNIASDNRYGIGIEDSDHNDLNNNTANANEWNGIILRHSRYNTLNNNNVSKNRVGIYVHSSQYNELSNNNASNNSVGIEQALSDNNKLKGNIASKNRCGIFLYKCNKNEITGNTLNSNGDCGIYLRYSDDNDLSNNTVCSSRLGIHLVDYSRNNTLKDNFLSNNSEGIKVADDSDSHIHNNEISDRDILQTPSYNHFFGSSPLNREVIDRHGKLPPLETEEQKQNWSDSLEELGKSVITGTNGRAGLFPNYMYPNGKVLSCGENSLGYFVVVFYKNLTIEKQLIYEIYTIIDENARDMGIQEIPVEFESAVFRYDGGYVDVLATLKEKQKIPLEEYMNRESASYRPDIIATYGKLPEIETEEQCWEWFHRDTPAIMHGSRDRMDPYFTDGILVSCGPYIDGYIEVTIYENLTIEKQPIMDEIYGIIDEEAKKIGIHEVPVVFFKGEFVRLDPGLLIEDSNDDAALPGETSDEAVPGFGLLGVLISFFGGWLFRRKRV